MACRKSICTDAASFDLQFGNSAASIAEAKLLDLSIAGRQSEELTETSISR